LTPIRILYVEPSQQIGGSDLTLYELTRKLDRSRYQPVVLFYQPHPAEENFRSAGAEVIRLQDHYPPPSQDPVYGRAEFPRACRIARIVLRSGIRLVHHNAFLRKARANIFTCSFTGVPQLCHVHNPLPAPGWERILSASVDRFLFVSKYVRDRYLECGIPKEKGSVVYNPIDTAQFAHQEKRDIVRAELVLSGCRVVANVARIDTWRGHHHFLIAMSRVMERYPDVRALIVGAFTAQAIATGYDGQLRQMAIDLGIDGRVIYTGFRKDIPEMMAAADIVVHSATRPEGFGRAPAEALAAARPTIVTDAGGVTEIVEDGVTGRVVPRSNPDAMADAILWMLENPAAAKAMAIAGRDRVVQRFGLDSFVSAMQDIYDQVVALAPGR